MRSTGGIFLPRSRDSGRASRPQKALSGCGWGRVAPGSFGPSLEGRFRKRQRARIRVDGRSEAERNRAQVLAVTERQVVQDRNAERLAVGLEGGLPQGAAH